MNEEEAVVKEKKSGFDPSMKGTDEQLKQIQ